MSAAATEALALLPEGWVANDPILAELVAALVVGIDELDSVAADTNVPGWTKLVDPNSADLPRQARWAGQLIGAQVREGLNLEDTIREVTRARGWNRGTLDSIKAAAALYVTIGEPTIIERDGSPYRFRVQWYQAQLNGVNQATTEQAVRDIKPAGLIVTFEVLPGATWADLDDEFGTWQSASTFFATPVDAYDYVPGTGSY